MTEKRKQEIKLEAERRLNMWLQNSTFEEMTCGGSYVRFNMALGLAGCPLTEHWMDESFYKPFITDNEFWDDNYDDIIYLLFTKINENGTI